MSLKRNPEELLFCKISFQITPNEPSFDVLCGLFSTFEQVLGILAEKRTTAHWNDAKKPVS